jgi:hypothetical protein
LPLISVSSQVVQSSLSQLPIVPSPSPTLPRAVVRTTQVAVASTKLVPSPTPAVPPSKFYVIFTVYALFNSK